VAVFKLDFICFFNHFKKFDLLWQTFL
jgi:hypothetical protein